MSTSKATVRYDGQSASINLSPSNNTVNYPMYLFARNVDGQASGFSNRKLGAFKIWDNGILIRNYIPCYRKSDNVIGLYDLVNNVFYTNAGTGTFLKGADVNKGIECVLRGYNLAYCSTKNRYLYQSTSEILSLNSFIGKVNKISTATNSAYVQYSTQVKPNTKYTIYFKYTKTGTQGSVPRVAGYANKSLASTPTTYISGSSTQLPNDTGVIVKTITSGETEFLGICFFFYENTMPSDDFSLLIEDFMIVEGTQALPYQSYFEPKTLSLPSSVTVDGREVQLRFAKVHSSDVLSVDRINNSVIYTQNNKYYQFTGNESLHRYINYEYKDNIVMSCNVSGVLRTKINIIEGLCNKFKGETPNNFVNMNRPYCFTTNTNQLWFSFPKELIGATDETTTTEMYQLFKAWIKTQNEKGDYIYSYFGIKPIEYDLTDTEIGQSLLALAMEKGTNILEVKSEIPVSRTDLSYWRQIIPNEQELETIPNIETNN
jgi:hypothetical protein